MKPHWTTDTYLSLGCFQSAMVKYQWQKPPERSQSLKNLCSNPWQKMFAIRATNCTLLISYCEKDPGVSIKPFMGKIRNKAWDDPRSHLFHSGSVSNTSNSRVKLNTRVSSIVWQLISFNDKCKKAINFF